MNSVEERRGQHVHPCMQTEVSARAILHRTWSLLSLSSMKGRKGKGLHEMCTESRTYVQSCSCIKLPRPVFETKISAFL